MADDGPSPRNGADGSMTTWSGPGTAAASVRCSAGSAVDGSRIARARWLLEHRRLSRYDTMTMAEVCALPVERRLAAERAHLYLWVPNALIADGLRVMEAWG